MSWRRWAVAIMSDEIKKPDHRIVALGSGKWLAYLHGELVTDLQGRAIEFDTQDDARAFLDESDARASSVDS
jgi:hypothetical protein